MCAHVTRIMLPTSKRRNLIRNASLAIGLLVAGTVGFACSSR